MASVRVSVGAELFLNERHADFAMQNETRFFQAQTVEASKTAEGVAVKVTFGSGAAISFELPTVESAIGLVCVVGKALDEHRAALAAAEVGGS